MSVPISAGIAMPSMLIPLTRSEVWVLESIWPMMLPRAGVNVAKVARERHEAVGGGECFGMLRRDP